MTYLINHTVPRSTEYIVHSCIVITRCKSLGWEPGTLLSLPSGNSEDRNRELGMGRESGIGVQLYDLTTTARDSKITLWYLNAFSLQIGWWRRELALD